MYYGRKVASETSRSNVDLGLMQSHVHTIMSKVDNPLVFKFTKRKDSQLLRVNRLNALRVYDQNDNDWDIKDIAGKKQAIIYGRAIFSYYADSVDGVYKAHLDNVDVYDFLIDPAGGGLDIELANYLGDYGVKFTKEELKEGVKKKVFLKNETEALIEGPGTAGDWTQEDLDKFNRTRDTNVNFPQKTLTPTNDYKFWRWGTTFENERYYLLLSEKGGTAIRVEKLKDVFESNMWWYWTYAAFLDMTEFWTPGYCDYVREVFMAQAVSINQMLDNGEQVNKPQKIVDTSAIENLAELKYRREGIIRTKKGIDARRAIQIIETPSIQTPIMVYEKLDSIQEKATGVTAGAQGDSNQDKVAIYEGNQANAADRFGLFNKSYSFGYKRFAKLYQFGVKEHLIRKIAIDLLGPDGVELVEISKKDIFWKDDTFNTIVESSNAELAMSNVDKKNKLTFLSNNSQNGVQNQKKAYEMQATISGFDEEEIRQLMDTSEFGDAELMAEADMDIEELLDGQDVLPNPAATTAYKQRFVDYMTKNMRELKPQEFNVLANYVTLLEPIIIQNMVRMANQKLEAEQLAAGAAMMKGGEIEPGANAVENMGTEDPTGVEEPVAQLPFQK